MSWRDVGRSPRKIAGAAGLVVFMGALLALAAGAQSQEGAAAADVPSEESIASGLMVWKVANCGSCHGQFGQGGGGGPVPEGPSIRRTALTPDLIVEVVSCGRPGTAMPAHLEGAYTEISCFGLPVGQVPPQTTLSTTLNSAEIAALTDYLVAWVVGKRNVRREECEFYFGGPHPNCNAYQ